MSSENKVIFTISPVRHLRDGLLGNSTSKAVLVAAVSEIIQQHPNSCTYFPAFEIVLDDLRDYRFYGDDLVQPSSKAVEYIWQKFIESSFDTKSREYLYDGKKIHKMKSHRFHMADKRRIEEFSNKISEMELLRKGKYFE